MGSTKRNNNFSTSNTTFHNNDTMKDGASRSDCSIQKDKLLFEEGEMPKGLREPFIRSGYRRAYSTPWQCFKSLVYLNNESFNVWSHVLTTCYFLVRFGMAALTQSNSLLDPFNLPLLASAFGTLMLYSTSSVAHLFNSMSERGYKICFFFDYAAVSLYTFTSSQAMFFYARPMNTQWVIFEWPSLYLCLAALFSFLVTYGCCKTDAAVNKFSTLLRALPVLVAWVFSTLPFTVGVTLCSCHATSISCRAFSACSNESIGYYLRHVFCTILAGFMYSSRLPERLFPGRFDLIGNSHHFLHLCVALATEYAFKIMELNVSYLKNENLSEETTAYVSIINTIVVAILVMFINAGISLWFAKNLRVKESVYKNYTKYIKESNVLRRRSLGSSRNLQEIDWATSVTSPKGVFVADY